MTNWKKNYLTILSGQFVSHLTSSVLQFAIVWYINSRTQSETYLLLAMLVGFFPRAVLGSFVGVFIDRYDRKKIMIISDLAIAAVSIFPIIAWLIIGEIPLWIIFVVLFLRAVGSAFHDPTMHAVTPQIAPKEALVKCASYAQGADSIVLILSPAIAAVLNATWSLGSIILLDVLGALIAVFALRFSNIPKAPPQKDDLDIFKIVREAKEGFAVLRSNRGLTGLVIITSFYSLAMMPIGALFPFMCTKYFGGTDYHSGFVEIVFAVGLLIGSFVLNLTGGMKNKIHSITASCVLMTAALFTGGILNKNQFAIFAVASFFMGFSGPFYWGAYRPLLQAGFEEKHLGRVMALTSSITVIASPVGMLLSIAFSNRFGGEKWFILASVMTLLCAIACMSIKNIRLAGEEQKGDFNIEKLAYRICTCF